MMERFKRLGQLAFTVILALAASSAVIMLFGLFVQSIKSGGQ